MWCFGKTYKSNIKHEDKVALVTGANSGIGFEAAKYLYQTGAQVVLLCRNNTKALKALQQIKGANPEINDKNISYKHLDLADLTSVRRCAEELLQELPQIHILINNAGICLHSGGYTKNGFEIHMGTNYFGPFLFTLLLLPRLINTPSSRIINVSSASINLPFIGGQLQLDETKRQIHPLKIYAQTKTALTMFTKELARKLKEVGVETCTTYSVEPGFLVATEIGQNMKSKLWDYIKNWICYTAEQGAATILYCSLEEGLSNETGKHYKDLKESSLHPIFQDQEKAKQLWDISINNVNLNNNIFHVKNNK